jgi:type IV pilus assembly protein PilA
MKTNKSGFTLIELLVVIAIIGILAAVVLASLNDARKSGSDASVKQSLGNARSQAEIVYNKNSAFSYAGVCTDAQVVKLVNAAHKASGAVGTATFALGTAQTAATNPSVCHSNATAWVISAPTATSNTVYWCVDSTGKVGTTTTAIAATTGLSCP